MKTRIFKKVNFICLSLFLTTINFLDSTQPTQPQKILTFSNEDTVFFAELNDSLSYHIQKAQQQNTDKEFKRIFRESSIDKTSKSISFEPHSIKKYGPAAPMLDRCQEFLELCRQEAFMLDQVSTGLDI